MDWTGEDLSKWMEAVNIAIYSAILQQGGVVKGEDLQSVDDLFLMEIGVSDDFHRLSILQCVEELVQGQSSLVREGVTGREGVAGREDVTRKGVIERKGVAKRGVRDAGHVTTMRMW